MWIQLSTEHTRPTPVLTIIDSSTKLMAARVLNSEQTTDFISALERGWIRHFGAPHTLQIDEARGWSSETLRSWSSDHGIFLEISPGQAHTRLSVLERRHQVLRRAVELFVKQHLQQRDVDPRAAIETALIYVVPQINNVPNIHGYSATQWAFGQNPKLPGHLMDTDLTIAQLTPSQQMQEKLDLKQQAATAVLTADNDTRLRRALLRQHQAQQHTYSTGQQVFYWRDAPGGAGPKIKWKGPAVIVMVEDGRAGPLTNIYWIAHGTTLLRASGEHLRPHFEQAEQAEATPLSRAQQALDNIRGRSTTLYIDLNKTNKRKREEVATEDEEESNENITDLLETDMVPAQDDYWDISEDGITWTRVHVKTRQELYTPQQDPRAPWNQFRADRLTLIRRPPPHQRFVIRDDWTESNSNRDLNYRWTGTTTFTLRASTTAPTPQAMEDTTMTPETTTPSATATNTVPSPIATTEADRQRDDTLPPIPESPATIPSVDMSGSEPLMEPDPSRLTTPQADNASSAAAQQMPPDIAALYQPQQPGETFEEFRSRYQQQETLNYRQPQYGPATAIEHTSNRSTPYNTPQRPNTSTPNAEADVAEVSYTGHDVDVLDGTTMSLPPGWIMEHGYLTLEEPKDEWSIKDGWLIRKHYVPRQLLFDPETTDETTCPLPLSYLTKDRVTKTPGRTIHDQWTKHRNSATDLNSHSWTGTTKFKIHQTHRQQAREHFYNVSDGHATFTQPQPTTTPQRKAAPKMKARKDQLSEKNMSTADRLAFWEAKKKELESFFQNDVWTYDDAENASPGRILKGHFILKWSKWPSGLPRAKARFITQGFRDPDALEGKINTESKNTQPHQQELHPHSCSNKAMDSTDSRHQHSLLTREGTPQRQNTLDLFAS